MSIVSVRSALEVALNSVVPAIPIAWENTSYTPVAGTPYQRVRLIPAAPENPGYGDFKREVGIFQVDLNYPLQVGPNVAASRAELLQNTFYRGSTFVSGAVTVIVERTPEIGGAVVDDAWYMVPLRVRYFANIG